MPKQIPECPDKPPITTETGRSYQIELITPMVGGGASPGVVDPDFPIRPTAIRGHLRHWWRLIRGHALGDKMRQREEEIFGSTEFPSPVTVTVKPLAEQKDRKFLPISSITPTSNRGYVLFPSIDKRQDLLDAGFRFQLCISWCSECELLQRRKAQNQDRKPDEQLPTDIAPVDEDVDAALKAWILFGGIGARTRRGCGSLRVFAESTPTFRSLIPKQLLNKVLNQMPPSFRVFQAKTPQLHSRAWEQAVELLKKFRQCVPARRSDPRRKFPESETLRRMMDWSSQTRRAYSEVEIPNGFPRAELGLPIVFQFKNGTGPESMIVLPTGTDAAGKPLQRMSSPIILKPIPVSEKDSLATIMVVNEPRLPTIDVAPAANQKEGRKTSTHPITDKKLSNYGNSPLAASDRGSALEAFLAFARSQDFEVTR